MLMGVDPRLVVGVVDLFMDLYKEAKRLLEERELDSSFRLFTDFIESQKFLDRPQYVEELRDAYNSRGHIRYMWVKFDEAVVDYSKAIELDSEFAVAYYNRGQVHYRLGRFKMAKIDLERCLELNPSFTDAKLNLVQVMKDLERQHHA